MVKHPVQMTLGAVLLLSVAFDEAGKSISTPSKPIHPDVQLACANFPMEADRSGSPPAPDAVSSCAPGSR
jgi:hypothetical protein